MAHYECPNCKSKSDPVPTKAEADQLLETHRKYFCHPARPAPARTGQR